MSGRKGTPPKAERLPPRLWPPATPADAQAAAAAFLVSRGWRSSLNGRVNGNSSVRLEGPSGQWWTHERYPNAKTWDEALAFSAPALIEWVARLELRLQDLEQRRPADSGPDQGYYERIAEDAIARDKWSGR